MEKKEFVSPSSSPKKKKQSFIDTNEPSVTFFFFFSFWPENHRKNNQFVTQIHIEDSLLLFVNLSKAQFLPTFIKHFELLSSKASYNCKALLCLCCYPQDIKHKKFLWPMISLYMLVCLNYFYCCLQLQELEHSCVFLKKKTAKYFILRDLSQFETAIFLYSLLEAFILELLNNWHKLCPINIQQICPSCKTTLMIYFHELLITFHPCCEGLNQPFSTDTVSLQIWGWRLVSRRVNKGSSSSSGAANMDCIILQSKKRKAA